MGYEAKRGFRRVGPFIQSPKIIALAVYKASLLHDYCCDGMRFQHRVFCPWVSRSMAVPIDKILVDKIQFIFRTDMNLDFCITECLCQIVAGPVLTTYPNIYSSKYYWLSLKTIHSIT